MPNLEGLNIHSLRTLGIHFNRNFFEIGNELNLFNLETINVSNCKNLNDLKGFENLRNLRVIRLEDCGSVFSLAPLLKLEKLEEVYLNGTRISDGIIRDITGLPSMKKLYFDDHKTYDIGLREALEKLGVEKEEWPLCESDPKKWRKYVIASSREREN